MSQNSKAYCKLDKTDLGSNYVIFVRGNLVAKGGDIEKMLNEVRQKYPTDTPFVARVPDDRMLVLYH